MLEAVTPGHRFSKNIDRCEDEQADQRCGDEPRHVGLPSYIWRYQASLSVRLTGDKGEGAGSCISACRAINETTDTERWSKSRAPGFLQPSPNAAVRAFPYGPVAPTPKHAPPDSSGHEPPVLLLLMIPLRASCCAGHSRSSWGS